MQPKRIITRIRDRYIVFASLIRQTKGTPPPFETWKRGNLADSNEETDGAWVPVLEELKFGTADGRNLVTNRLAGSTWATGDDVAVAGLDARDGLQLGAGADTVVGSLLGWEGTELLEVKVTLVVEGVSTGLELALLREQEDKGAGLASVGVGDVKVEQSALSGRDSGVVLSTVGRGWVGRVNRHNQVRVLVGASKVGRASRARGGWCRRGSRGGGSSRRGSGRSCGSDCGRNWSRHWNRGSGADNAAESGRAGARAAGNGHQSGLVDSERLSADDGGAARGGDGSGLGTAWSCTSSLGSSWAGTGGGSRGSWSGTRSRRSSSSRRSGGASGSRRRRTSTSRGSSGATGSGVERWTRDRSYNSAAAGGGGTGWDSGWGGRGRDGTRNGRA